MKIKQIIKGLSFLIYFSIFIIMPLTTTLSGLKNNPKIIEKIIVLLFTIPAWFIHIKLYMYFYKVKNKKDINAIKHLIKRIEEYLER